MKQKVYQKTASLIVARENCAKNGNDEWFDVHSEKLDEIAKNHLPSGSGVDSGTQVDLDRSTGKKIVLHTSYHHMNDGGMYDGWTDHTITVTPSFLDFDLKISGRNRNDIKDYLGDLFYHALMEEIEG